MSEELDSKYYRSETIKITLPVFLELLVSSLFGMVDMIMVGNSGAPAVTTPSLAAIGITNQMMFIGIALTQALATGGTTMIARYVGANRKEKIPTVLKHLLIIVFVLLVVPFMITTQTNPAKIMSLIGAKEDAIMIGLKYFRITTIGFLFQSFNLAIFSSMRGTGDTSTPMKINLFVNLCNVIGNYILIFGKFGLPKLGVTGAGVSTTLAQILATSILLYILIKEKTMVKLQLKEKFSFDRSTMKNLFTIGGPAVMEQIIFRVGILMFVRIVSSLGTIVYATHQIGLNILSLSYSPGQSFGIAASTLVGRSLGEKRIDKAENFIKVSYKLAVYMSFILTFVFFFFGKTLTGFYTSDPQIIAQSENILKLMAFIQPLQAITFVLSGSLRGAGDTISTLIVTLISVLFVRLISAFVLINYFSLGLMGAWIAMFIDQVVRFFGVTFRYRLGDWKYIKLS